eukprot:sb/3468292/
MSSFRTNMSRKLKVLDESVFGDVKLELFTQALGLNSRFAHHRHIKRRTKSRRSSIYDIRKKPKLNEGIKCMTLNPKCVSLEKLYGQFDKDSYEWADGILATIIRRFAKESTPFQADGAASRGVSASGPHSRLSRASTAKSGLATPGFPKSATPNNTKPVADVSADFPVQGKNFINTMLEMSVDAGLDFLRTQAEQGQIPLKVPEISVVRTLCSLITAHLNIVSENGGFGKLYSAGYSSRLLELPLQFRRDGSSSGGRSRKRSEPG